MKAKKWPNVGIKLGRFFGADAGGGRFTPDEVTGLIGYYDFSDLATLFQDTARTTPVTTDAQTIKGVTDKSGQGNHLSNATGVTYKAAIQNGKSVARLNGSTQWLGNAAPTGMVASGLTAFFVGTRTGSPVGGVMVNVFSGSVELRWDGAGTSQQITVNTGGGAVTTPSTVSGWHVTAARWDYANDHSEIFLDGAQAATGSDNTAVTPNVIHVGARNGANFLAGDCGAVLVYAGAKTSGDVVAVTAFLKGVWGTP